MNRVMAICAGLLWVSLNGCGETAEPSAASAPVTPVNPEAAATSTPVSDARLVQAASEHANWLTHGRTYDEQRYSPLDQINKDSISELGLAWSWDTGTTRGLEATPIVVDGVMYTTGTWSVVYAHDARSGDLLWRFDPQVPRTWGYNACCDIVNRGVAVWEDLVYVGTLDGRLIALNRSNGDPVWEELTINPELPYTITGAPRVVNGKVVIGNGGAELGVRGYVTAYNARDGKQVWRFYTVPGDPGKPFEHAELELAAQTWRGGEWWKVGGGGTVWDAFAFDPELNLLYIGVGNGAPWSRYIRSPGGGDNLFLASIVAVDADSGRMAWHYQTTPGDHWDYTAVQQMILADIEIGGVERKVIMQAPKNGFFYVLDRRTGEFLSAETYVPITWASHVDPETGRPVENPNAQYTDDPIIVRPGPAGGHNWHPMSFSPQTGLVYVPIVENRFVYAQERNFAHDPETWNLSIDVKPNRDLDDGWQNTTKLLAWDPVKQEARWALDHQRDGASGVLATAGGLVFQPGSDCSFAAFDAQTGDKIWETTTQMGTIAAPVSYSVDGEQYIAFVAGWGGAAGLYGAVPCADGRRATTGRILAYKLGGQHKLAPAPLTAPVPEPVPRISDNPDLLAQGEQLFLRHCGFCHALGPDPEGVVPNLANTSADTHKIWDAIVLGGAKQQQGMISFAHLLDQQQSHAIQAFVIDQAHVAKARRLAREAATGP